MMHVKQFRYGADNLGYLLYGKTEAIAIDGGAVENILEFVHHRNLTLKYVTNTHSHPDHTSGNVPLLNRSKAMFLDRQTVVKPHSVIIEDIEIAVYETPGHTSDSVIFYIEPFLITGDTLFIGKLGRCFSGDFDRFFNSAKFLLTFPDDTQIYPGHDYVEEYMAFIKRLEPQNATVDMLLDNYNPEHVYSTIADEKKVNPHLRHNTKEIEMILKKRNLPTATEYERWTSILSIE